MLLAIDIGNTNIMFSVFENLKITKSKIVRNKIIISENELYKIFNFLKNHKRLDGIIISSVVKKFNDLFKSFFIKHFNIKPFFTKNLLTDFSLKTEIKNKKSIGSDRIVNVIFAKTITKPPILIVDFGTATTIDFVNKNGVYEGGVITPGIDLSLLTLNKFTSKLPLVKFKKTKNIIACNTKSAIQSGFFWGYICMIEGLIKKIKKHKRVDPKLILTGGNARLFSDHIKNIFLIDDQLILKGLNYIFIKRNEKKK